MPKAITSDYIVKASGENESRELRLAKMDDGTYQIRLHWGRGDRDLATLNFAPDQWDRLASFSEGLKRK